MLNKMMIQGRLTKDVELRHTQSGVAVASFTVAWSEKRGENEQKLFLPCVAWRNSAEFASKYFGKGQECVVEGKLTSRKWTDKDGNNRETVELIVDQLHFCGSKNGNKAADPLDDLEKTISGFEELNNDDALPF